MKRIHSIQARTVALGLLLFCSQLATAQERPTNSGYPSTEFDITFQWGEISTPLERWATPYYFRGNIKIKKEQLPSLLQSPIQFFKNGKPFWIRGLDIRAIVNYVDEKVVVSDTTGTFPVRKLGTIGGAPVSVDSFSDQHALILTLETQSLLLEKMAEGDQFAFSNFVDRSSGLVINSLIVEIENPWQEFTPRFFVAYGKQDLDEVSSWQIVNLAGEKQRLRFDPSDTTNLKIRKIYADQEKYISVPVKSFRSVNRYISDADYVVPASKVTRVDTLVQAMLDPFDRLDYVASQNEKWNLHWGALIASISGSYYKPIDFYDKINQPMEIHQDDDIIPIRQMRVSIVPVEGDVEQLILDGRDPAQWYERMNKTPSRTSFYFDEILIEDVDGKVKLFPLQFTFNLL